MSERPTDTNPKPGLRSRATDRAAAAADHSPKTDQQSRDPVAGVPATGSVQTMGLCLRS
jgi:hypothetical protein